MPEMPPLCLNRIIAPQLPLPEFFQFANDLGFRYVELRNDLSGKEILDGLPDDAVRHLLDVTGINLLTINALSRFEDERALDANLVRLKGLIAQGKRVNCSQIVLCPLNEADDSRSPGQRADQLVTALNAFGPLFADANMTGLIEPLGFSVSALRTKKEALAGISQSDYSGSYKLLHDTFHHCLGEETEFFPVETALVHVSGVLPGKAKSAIIDADRVLVTGDDVLDNRGQVATLLNKGYTGPFSYEPFSEEVQCLSTATLKTDLQKSIEYLFS
ncbi:MAG: TIM barrel protein [Verrucomicrobia bacterium]|nr:TIM barrel protein [Verrucomicrobiota bacterium]